MYVIRWCMSEIIDLTKNIIGNCKFMQHAILAGIFVRTVLTDLLGYIMSIIVFNCQHCDEQQFQTLSSVHRFDWSINPICWKLVYMYVLWWCMSQIIDFKKITIGSCKFM